MVALCRDAASQIDSGVVAGMVTTTTGEVIKDAHVALIDADRNLRTRVDANATGLYLFPDVRPGHYKLEVTAPGFKTVLLSGIIVNVQDSIQENFQLAAGTSSETLTAISSTALSKMSGSVRTAIDQTLMRELPLNGRSFQTLFQLTPGIVIAQTSFASQGQFSANGQRTNTNNFLVDGVSANFGMAAGVDPGQSAAGTLPALSAFGSTNILVPVDAVQEFAIETSTYAPEFGRMPGAQISIVTRSGTNEWHGDVYDYLRNAILDSNDWFANRDHLPRAGIKQNDFGGNIGGPLQKGHTFVFASFEGLQLRQPAIVESLVPSFAARSAAVPAIRPFLDAYPLPQSHDDNNGLAPAIASFSDPSNQESGSIRFDDEQETYGWFARVNIGNSSRSQRGAQDNALSSVTITEFSPRTLTFGARQTWRSLANQFRANLSSATVSTKNILDGFGGAVPLPMDVPFPAPFNDGNSLFQFIPGAFGTNMQLLIGRGVHNEQRQIQMVNTVSWQLKNHLLRVGADVRFLRPTVTPAQYELASVFSGLPSVLNAQSSIDVVEAQLRVKSRFDDYSMFAQDTWSLADHLTATFGLRWDYAPAPSGRASNGLSPFILKDFISLSHFSIVPNQPLYKSEVKNFAPRVGFAYRLCTCRASVVLTGGAGVFYDSTNSAAGNAFSGNFFPFAALKILGGAQFPLTLQESSPAVIGTTPIIPPIAAYAPILRTPVVSQWNISLEGVLNKNQVVSLGYVGSSGHELYRTEMYTGGHAGVPTQLEEILFTNNAGVSSYNALQLTTHLLTKGLDLSAFYTLSHSLDNVSTDAVFQGIPTRFIDPALDYARSDFDIRHSASLAFAYQIPSCDSCDSLRGLFSNWSMNVISILRSAPPVDVVVSRDIGFGVYDFRPDVTRSETLYLQDSNAPGGRRLNPDAFLIPPIRQGALGRNALSGFPAFQTDIALSKQVLLRAPVPLQLRVEIFNVFNHPNFAPPSGVLGSVDMAGNFNANSGFGVSSQTLARGLETGTFGSGFASLYQMGGPRSVQIVLKLSF
ncbi:MAG: Cna protein B-type domain, TonB-dependent Receptor Plug Domain protein [Candidatus Sulfotelmatobacter sp.]|nr:Cna protein B-type domain, TonB-dependent Receptor Plug Domain protein [Candidatus Sulfotelmatobacter sp.]